MSQYFTGNLSAGDTVLFWYPGWVTPIHKCTGVIVSVIDQGGRGSGRGRKKDTGGKETLYEIEFVNPKTSRIDKTRTIRRCITENQGVKDSVKVSSVKKKFTFTRKN